ncbi:hypothetical protein VNO77_01029 [Canavalia gladiata]|uniref:Uncharacterized protein n=1 Tax=Canavalia gladiata TaxID=3824 RepID=A0AAN9MVC2_CANGL
MEALICQFSFLSDEALLDKTFDPSTMEELMKLFEIESYKAWAATMFVEEEKEVGEAEFTMQQADDHLHWVMDEFRYFEEELERMSEAEMDCLIETAESAS